MANREKGEASFEIDGKTYTLLVDTHAWAVAQDALTKGEVVPDLDLITKRLQARHVLSIIAVLWGALQRHHEDEFKTIRQATALMEKSEGKAVEALVQAISRGSADEKDLQELGIGSNPPPAQGEKKVRRGIGDRSISTPVASA